MLKILTILFFAALISQKVDASPKDTLLIFYKNSGKVVATKDSADYFRFILPPDTSLDREQYRIYDFYMNGKKKFFGTSFTSGLTPVLDGTCVSYFPNGKCKSIAIYKDGHLNGTFTGYYPNGNTYNILNFSTDSYGNVVREIKEWRDSTGTLLVVNGKGHVIVFNEDFTKVEIEGNVEKNRFEGEWNGLIADSGRYVCTFHKGVLKSGITYLKSGKQYLFKKLFTDATFNSGRDESFYQYIERNLQYPDVAKKHKIRGRVRLSFTINQYGGISNVKILTGLMPSLDEEAIRVVSQAPAWDAATQYGIPISVSLSISVDF